MKIRSNNHLLSVEVAVNMQRNIQFVCKPVRITVQYLIGCQLSVFDKIAFALFKRFQMDVKIKGEKLESARIN